MSKPLFVVGCPRSGTTLMGAYISKSKSVEDLGEYSGYDFCTRMAKLEMGNLPTPTQKHFLKEIEKFAFEYPKKFIEDGNNFCVSSPWNLLSVEVISRMEPDALFIFCVRRPEGVCQSLEKSRSLGYIWAKENTRQRLAFWLQFNEQFEYLPPGRTFLASYDTLCQNPGRALSKLDQWLAQNGIAMTDDARNVFGKSWASSDGSKQTLATMDNNGNLIWQSIPSWNSSRWKGSDQAELASNQRIEEIYAKIFQRFDSQL